jgi:hypothetical protein
MPTDQNLTVDVVAASLPASLRDALADLADSPDSVVVTTIALLPAGARMALEAAGAIVVTHAPYERVALTGLGRRLIDACAGPTTEVDEAELDARIEAVSERLAGHNH